MPLGSELKQWIRLYSAMFGSVLTHKPTGVLSFEGVVGLNFACYKQSH